MNYEKPELNLLENAMQDIVTLSLGDGEADEGEGSFGDLV